MTISELQAKLQSELPRLAKIENAQERIEELNKLAEISMATDPSSTLVEQSDLSALKQTTRRQIRSGINQSISTTWSWDLYKWNKK